MENRLENYHPYEKQILFHEMGQNHRERLFMAGNQTGKTWAGAAEVAIHATGRYPHWWKGHRYPKAITVLCGSQSAGLTRDGVQRLLLGQPEDTAAFGTGMIPKAAIVDFSKKQGVTDALESVIVRHAGGGNSVINFRSYDQGREKWQAATVDLVWLDEEPPVSIYTEALTRTNATRGLVFVTFTPLEGMSEVVKRFLQDEHPDRKLVRMSVREVGHYSPEDVARIEASYPDYEREARLDGVPMLGSGAIFPVREDLLWVEPFPIPGWWPGINAIDFGYEHPTAATQLAWDRDSDIIYVTREYRQVKRTPVEHALSLKAWDKYPWAWPHDGLMTQRDGNAQFSKQYKSAGLGMLADHAAYPDGSISVEAGVMEMLERMVTGRWRVFTTCVMWMEEKRMYHRKDGKIIALDDDLLCASRYGMMARRFGRSSRESRLLGQKQTRAKLADGAGSLEGF